MKGDKLFHDIKEKLKDHSYQVGDDSWELFQKSLTRKKRARIIKICSLSSVAAALALFLTIPILMKNDDAPLISQNEETEKIKVIENLSKENHDGNYEQLSSAKKIIEKSRSTSGGHYVKETKVLRHEVERDGFVLKENENIALSNKLMADNINIISQKLNEKKAEETRVEAGDAPIDKNDRRKVGFLRNRGLNKVRVIGEENKSTSDLELTIIGSSTLPKTSSNTSGSYALEAIAMGVKGGVSEDGLSNNHLAYSPFASGYKTRNMEFDYRYSVPISAGLLARKEITEKFSVESGIFFAKNSTSMILSDDGVVGENTIWSIGIPLKLHYTILENNNMSLYALAGGAVEKVVSSNYRGNKLYFDNSKITSQLWNNEEIKHRTTSDISPDAYGVQFSINIGAGVQYALMNFMSIFIEPNFSYYFNSESPIPTIRTERPLNLGFQAGLRFNL